jgi:CDP-glycerol glycerophosphotransferase (TagB/SpsB family)
MKWLQNAVKDLPILVVIKPHPSDKLSYEKYLSKWIRLAPADFDLQEILHSSDFIATISSSTAIEAVMLNKGIIVMLPKLPYDYHINYNGYPYFLAKAKAGIVIRTTDDARSEISRLYKEQSYREDIVQRGQHFLDQTLTSTVHKPSHHIRQLVDDYFRNR